MYCNNNYISVSESLKKFASFKEWFLIIVGIKAPHEEYIKFSNENSNETYMTPKYQEDNYLDISDMIRWR